jgi:serine/threonine protein kinase
MRSSIISTDNRRQSMHDESVKFHARDFLSVKQEDLLADYELGDVLGEGGFGLVYSCIHRATGAERAVKMLKKDPNYPHIQDNILNEFNVLKDLDHPVSCCHPLCWSFVGCQELVWMAVRGFSVRYCS